MRLPLIFISKFVGTVSLGLLTGVSYTLSTIALPSLLHLSTAPTAAQTHAFLAAHSRGAQKLLSGISVGALTFAFLFSPRRARHPYLIWTALVAGAAWAPGLERLTAHYFIGPEAEIDVDAGVNGEVVRRGVEQDRAVEGVRAGIWGLAFAMGLIGIWGDGA
ncbi:hypothetical protein EJ06DRAFT_476068 [Trichodelitschia bisporula]|uniref:DUF1772-domain-containing protein n=1 Tax=Trichodelitschia bisporula TaxID=703511 RepID=A0A6G1HY86_9PEZI|nr:hypothetical protein EJ06DRAFT_476068 [Trichodelitschia bisporula]